MLEKDLLLLQNEMGTLQSAQEIIDEDLQIAMDQLLEKVQRLCEQHHNKGSIHFCVVLKAVNDKELKHGALIDKSQGYHSEPLIQR